MRGTKKGPDFDFELAWVQLADVRFRKLEEPRDGVAGYLWQWIEAVGTHALELTQGNTLHVQAIPHQVIYPARGDRPKRVEDITPGPLARGLAEGVGLDRFTSDELARAAETLYFWGHWHPTHHPETDERITDRTGWDPGWTWKASSLLDQELQRRWFGEVVSRRREHGHGWHVEIHQGVVRLCLSAPDFWTWKELAYATEVAKAQITDLLALTAPAYPGKDETQARRKHLKDDCYRFCQELPEQHWTARALLPWDTSPFYYSKADGDRWAIRQDRRRAAAAAAKAAEEAATASALAEDGE